MKKWILILLLNLTLIPSANATILFFDNFDNGARPEWGNENGNWTASSGVYSSSATINVPSASRSSVTTLPNLTDFIVEVDINNIGDGGIFLRSTDDQNNAILLITGGGVGTNNGFYWHVIQNGSVFAGENGVQVPNLIGSNQHLRIEVIGNNYKAYLNNNTEPITTLNKSGFSSGSVALYEVSNQSFDNFSISDFNISEPLSSVIPEPASMILFGTGLAGAFFRRRFV